MNERQQRAVTPFATVAAAAVAAAIVAAVVVAPVVATVVAAVGAVAGAPAHSASQRTSDPRVATSARDALPAQAPGEVAASAAYLAVPAEAGAVDVRLPRWRGAFGAGRLTSAVAVANVSAVRADVTIRFFDAQGAPIAGCDADCSATIAPGGGHLFWVRDLAGIGKLEGQSATARIIARQPVVATVLDVALSGGHDASAARAFAVDPPLRAPTRPGLPLALVKTGLAGRSAGGSTLYVANLDAGEAATIEALFDPQPSGNQVSITLPSIAPGETEIVDLAGRTELPNAAYAVTLTGVRPMGALVDTEWPDQRSAAAYDAPRAETDVVVPIVFRRDAARCSLVTVQNTALRTVSNFDYALAKLAESRVVLTGTLLVEPASSVTLDLCRDRRFDALGDGFAGVMRLAAGNVALSVQSFIETEGTAAIAGFEGAGAELAGSTVYAPVVPALWSPEPDDPVVPRYDARIAVYNPGRVPADVSVAYEGVAGPCAGKSYAQSRSVPPFATVLLRPGPDGDRILPGACVAAAAIGTKTGSVVAAVLIEGQLQPPTATPRPTHTATDTITATATDTPTPTDTLTPRASRTATTTVTTSATPTESVTGTDTPRPTDTRTGTPGVSPSATASVTATPPRTTPRPAVPKVPPDDWWFLRGATSILPFDWVRYLEVDSLGATWIRLVDPAGGPDAVVYVGRDGRWTVFRGGIKAAVEALGLDEARKIGGVRDFFDIDAAGRVWVGPERYDGSAWTRVAADERSPLGGVYYDRRVLIDPDGHAWVPYSVQPDCPPPGQCGVAGVRALDDEGRVVAEVTVADAIGGTTQGVSSVALVGQRWRPSLPAPSSARASSVLGAQAASGSARALSVPGAQAAFGSSRALSVPGPRAAPSSARASSVPGPQAASGSAAAASRPARLSAPGQTGGATWLAAPDAWYSLPDATPRDYPFLAPRSVPGGLDRTIGYGTAAAVSPDGRLQVITWLERYGATEVSHHIVLNTLVDDEWRIEDLTGTPFLGDEVTYTRIVAMDYCATGELWVATADGRLGVRRDGNRPDGNWTIYPRESGVLGNDPAGVTDIDCGPDGAVWVGTPGGLAGYGFDAPPGVVQLPVVSRGH